MTEDRQFLLELRERLDAYLTITPPASAQEVIEVASGDSIQAAWDKAYPGARIELEPGGVFGPFTCTPKGEVTTPITITTAGWQDTGPGLPGLVAMKAKRGQMATIQRASSGANIEIPNGSGAGYVSLFGVAIQPSAATGAGGTLVRIGNSTETDPTKLARNITFRQVHLAGDRAYGTKRGIEANGADIAIDQCWVEEVWSTGQDAQAVCAWNGGHGVTVRHSYLAAGAENVMLGGARVAGAAMQPKDWLVEECILHKPERWKADGLNRQVKNLFEVKHASNVTVRRTLMIGNWIASQSGYGIVVTYATQGTSPESRGIKDIRFEDVALLKSPAAIQMSGFSYYADSQNADRLERVSFDRLYYVQGNGASPRILMISNVHGRHDLAIRDSVFVHNSNAIMTAEYGKAWSATPLQVIPGGPMKGFILTGSTFSRVGAYQITAPGGVHFGNGLAAFVNEDLAVRLNVFGGATSAFLANMNAVGGGNRAEAPADIEARYGLASASGLPIQAVLDYQRYLPEA
jgi:hypothetical protein